ncbi:hypothetical protein [Thalassobacillus cyri]|nr:hypothetical protein [Thalassobacillus cyri]
MSKEIRENSIYLPVAIEYIGGKTVKLPHELETAELITKVIVKDREGNYYKIGPNEKGLRFAKGEISYKEYLKLKRKENRRFFTYFTSITGSFFIAGWTIIKFFL